MASCPWLIPFSHFLGNSCILYREGRKRQIVAWEQVRFIQRQVAYIWGKPQGFYLVQLVDGSQIAPGLLIADIEELGDAIEQEMTRLFLPTFLADYEAGKPLVFPGLCITNQYISSSEEKIPWIQVEQFEVSSEKLVISERGSSQARLSLPVQQIPNLCVLLALLEHIGKHV
ncbi:hypothetical protein KSD_70720 [Ktedonobacter sp. SOSP1-85]|uniref:DUF6585 family protein n=1 Tax=Ktedonobacter sp. SOSP1-85 TaxID=2778367 RepID=UPI001915527B|nr:DUF6585 family protein [Ktedonobacter sp. SOSP1-85]GHO79301.1 hypothetical protein KSD_70720 [Ktedonobacter sp. SOSP1-85]